MGAWDVGPFDNDTAADFGDDLDEAPATQREGRAKKPSPRLPWTATDPT